MGLKFHSAWKWLALAAGIGLFVLLAGRVDWGEVGRILVRIGWLTPLLLVPFFIVYLVDCLGWRVCLPERIGANYWRLFRIRWAGESVNNLLPSAYVGGEAVKVLLLSKYGVAAQAGACGAVVSKTAQSVAQLVFVLIAGVVGFRMFGGGNNFALGLAVLPVLGAGVMALFLVIQKRGMLRTMLGVGVRLGINPARFDRFRGRIEEFDGAISAFHTQHPGRFFFSFGFYLAGWFLDTLEILVAAAALGMPLTWTQALVIEAFTGVAKAAGMWIPGSLGVQEAGIVMLGRLTGIPDTLAVTYALMRRARETVFALAGLVFLSLEHIDWRELRKNAALPTN